jgi:hypothetical protein
MAVPPGIDDPACRRLRGALYRSIGENTAIAGNVTGDKGREMLGIWRVREASRAGWRSKHAVRNSPRPRFARAEEKNAAYSALGGV